METPRTDELERRVAALRSREAALADEIEAARLEVSDALQRDPPDDSAADRAQHRREQLVRERERRQIEADAIEEGLVAALKADAQAELEKRLAGLHGLLEGVPEAAVELDGLLTELESKATELFRELPAIARAKDEIAGLATDYDLEVSLPALPRPLAGRIGSLRSVENSVTGWEEHLGRVPWGERPERGRQLRRFMEDRNPAPEPAPAEVWRDPRELWPVP